MNPTFPSTEQRWKPVSASFVGMLVGWAVMLVVVIAVVGVMLLFEGESGLSTLWITLIFGMASAVVCGVAWLFVAWPLTALCWGRIRRSAWWSHGILGLLAGASVGFLPCLLSDRVDGASLAFVGLAALVGAVAGTATGWWAWKERILEETKHLPVA